MTAPVEKEAGEGFVASDDIRKVLAENDVVAVGEDYLVVRTKALKEDDGSDPGKPLQQLSAGMGGETLYATLATTDYNSDFTPPLNYQRYREMRTDSQVRNSLRIAKAPVLGARWFMKPATNDPIDVHIADFVWRNLTEWMSTSWQQMLIESMYMLDYGFYAFEQVIDIVPDPTKETTDNRVVWRRFVPLHPIDISDFVYADDGGPESIKLSDQDETEIPITKTLVFTFDKEGGDMRGQSLLRSAFKHHFFKDNLYKIDAIQKERHSVGIPIIKLPPSAKPGDVNLAHQIGENLRSNEKAHVVVPPTWDISFAKLEGQPVSALESAKHHGEMIYENVLGHMLDTKQGEAMFLKSSKFIAETVRDTWNKFAIPRLVRYNWPEDEIGGFPQLMVRRLGDTTDWRQISFAIRNFIGSKVITPDDRMEEWARDELDLPIADPTTARELPTRAQIPGSTSPSANVGPSQQTPPSANPPADVSRGGRDVGGA